MSAKGQPRFRKFVPSDVALDIVQAMDHPGLFKQWFDGPVPPTTTDGTTCAAWRRAFI